jgi:PAS domain S-box-containing protein
MSAAGKNTGADFVGDIPFGTHFCLFYETKADLLEIAVSYCKAGLERRQFCLWVVPEPLTVDEALHSLRREVQDLDRYLADQGIEIVAARDWYLRDGKFELDRVLRGWNEKLENASARGHAGVRVTGDTAWLEGKDWKDFCEYEDALHQAVANQRLIVLCTYPLNSCGAAEVLDVVRTHQYAVTKRRGKWDVIETADLKQAKAEIKRLNAELEQRVVERTRQLTLLNRELTREVRQRQRVENGLRRSEAYLAEAQRVSHTGSFGWSVSGGEIVWSNETFRIFGTDPAHPPTLELIVQRTHPEDRAFVQEKIEEMVRERRAFDFEHRLLMGDGSVKYVRVVGHPSTKDEGDDFEFVGAVTDITDGRRVEQTLREREAYLEEAQRLTHTGSGAWQVNGDDALYLSEEWYRIYGFDPKHGLSAWKDRLPRMHPEDQARVQEAKNRAIRERSDYEVEHRILLPDGTLKHTHTVGHPVLNASGEVEQFVCTMMDITDRKLAEEALLRSEAYLAEAQKLSHTGSWACKIATREMIHSSEEHRRLFGLDPEKKEPPLLDEFLQRIHPEDRQRTVDDLEKAIGGGTNIEAHFRVVLPEGTTRYMYGIGHPVVGASGNTGEFVGSVMDVTERKQGEALREGERRVLEMIARDAPLDDILEKLVRIVEERFAGAICSVLLLDEDGQHLRHAIAPNLPEPFLKAIDGLSIGPKAGSCGTAMYRGEPVFVSDILKDPLWEDYRAQAEPCGFRACWSTPILAHSGAALGSLAMYYREPRAPSPNETRALEMATHLAGIAIEHRHILEQLRRSEAYLTEAQRLSHTGSWAFNERKAIYWSEENFLIWGFDPQQGLPDRRAVLQRVHPEDRDRMLAEVRTAVLQKTDYVVEFRLVLPDGTIKHIRGLGRPVFNASGELIEVVGTQLDVTERKRAEEERERLRQAQAELAHINRVTTMGELTASLAHEIKQPIAAAVTDARTCVRWLNRDQPDLDEAREAAARIATDVLRASEIISRIGVLFKKGSAQQEEWVDMNELIQEMMILLRSEASRYSISIRGELADSLPPVKADRVQLQQVLMNLMLNGIEAMKEMGVVGELTIKSLHNKNGQLLVAVSDTGMGLKKEHAEQIFNAFFTTKPQGTGMGLPISRSIIESHGGRLWATSNSGHGATFQFTLPVEAAPSGASRHQADRLVPPAW